MHPISLRKHPLIQEPTTTGRADILSSSYLKGRSINQKRVNPFSEAMLMSPIFWMRFLTHHENRLSLLQKQGH